MSHNSLRDAHSPYLRSAAHQPVQWLSWGAEAFSRAREQNKPILLDIGAVWCHWCHVMDGESYENDEIAAMINADFIAVKVDRDERPDVDARYQKAIQAMTGQGGWPLTAFLTPAGVPFYGGTYFPPEPRQGRPGMPQVLRSVAAAYRDHPDKVKEQASRLLTFLSSPEATRNQQAVSDDVVLATIASMHNTFDEDNAGFGDAPKFPHPSALDLLFTVNHRLKDDASKTIITSTLKAMGEGGMYDQLAGGFHRYSTDAKWIVPHFEKMLYDNTELLRNYLYAYAEFRDPFFKEIAEGIIGWMNDVLCDRERGGFYGSQDADTVFGDDGTYFTWRMVDAQSILTIDEFAVAQQRFNIFADGEMHIDRSQNVLFIDRSIAEIAVAVGKSEDECNDLLQLAKAKMFAARMQRPTPFVDTTIYVGWNALAIRAYFDAAVILGRVDCEAFALQTLDRLLNEGFNAAGELKHTLAPDAPVNLLEDASMLIAALFHAFEVTGNAAYYDRALLLLRTSIEQLYDSANSGFNDHPLEVDQQGILHVEHKSIQDSPTPSANGVMCRNLLIAYWWTDDKTFLDAAEKTLARFAGDAVRLGLFASEYVHAVEEYLHPPMHVVVVGDSNDPRTAALRAAAKSVFIPGARLTLVDPALGSVVPFALKSMVAASQIPAAYVCAGLQCGLPATSPKELIARMKE